MNLLAAESPLAVATGFVVFAIFGGSVLLWITITYRLAHGTRIIRHEPRRHVPWNGGDVLMLAGAYFFIGIFVMNVFHHFDSPKQTSTVATHTLGRPLFADVDGDEKRGHPLMPLFNSHDNALIALGVFLAVVKAPLFEEFFFRVVFQGWVESAWIRSRRTVNSPMDRPINDYIEWWRQQRFTRFVPFLIMLLFAIVRLCASSIVHWLHQSRIGRPIPVLVSATLFAMLHFRFSREPAPPTQVAGAFLAQSVAEALWLALALFVLIGVRGASASDLGWPLRRVGYDLLLGLVAVLAVIPPVLLFSGLLESALRYIHSPVSGDPLPIFFLALALGTLYRRTHRMIPSLVLHIGLNGSSVLLFYLQSAIGQ